MRKFLVLLLAMLSVVGLMGVGVAQASPVKPAAKLTWHATLTNNITGKVYNLDSRADRAAVQASFKRAATACDNSVHDYTLRQGGYFGTTEVVAGASRERWTQITCGSINNQGVLVLGQWFTHGETAGYGFCQAQQVYNFYAAFGGKPFGLHDLYVRFKWQQAGAPCGQIASVDTILIIDYTHHVSQGRSYCVLPGCYYSGSANEQFYV